MPKSRFSRAWATAEDNHFFFNIIYAFDTRFSFYELALLRNCIRIEALHFHFLLIIKVEILWGFEFNTDIQRKFKIWIWEILVFCSFSASSIATEETFWFVNLYFIVWVLEAFPHFSWRFSVRIIRWRDEYLHLNIHFSRKSCNFLFKMIYIRFSILNSHLICKNDNLISILKQSVDYLRHRLMKPFPIISISCKLSSALRWNNRIIHIKRCYPLASFDTGRLANNASPFFSPSPSSSFFFFSDRFLILASGSLFRWHFK